jgi:hypothetical protein
MCFPVHLDLCILRTLSTSRWRKSLIYNSCNKSATKRACRRVLVLHILYHGSSLLEALSQTFRGNSPLLFLMFQCPQAASFSVHSKLQPLVRCRHSYRQIIMRKLILPHLIYCFVLFVCVCSSCPSSSCFPPLCSNLFRVFGAAPGSEEASILEATKTPNRRRAQQNAPARSGSRLANLARGRRDARRGEKNLVDLYFRYFLMF